MSTSIRNDPLSHERAPSHRKPAIPPAAEIASRLAAGETLAHIAAGVGRTAHTLRQDLADRGYDAATALPRVETPARRPLTNVEARSPFRLRYTSGPAVYGRQPLGRFKTREQAESACGATASGPSRSRSTT